MEGRGDQTSVHGIKARTDCLCKVAKDHVDEEVDREEANVTLRENTDDKWSTLVLDPCSSPPRYISETDSISQGEEKDDEEEAHSDSEDEYEAEEGPHGSAPNVESPPVKKVVTRYDFVARSWFEDIYVGDIMEYLKLTEPQDRNRLEYRFGDRVTVRKYDKHGLKGHTFTVVGTTLEEVRILCHLLTSEPPVVRRKGNNTVM